MYDKRDRLVMAQDGNMKTGTAKWLVTKYDDLNRPIETGMWTNATDVATHRANALNPATPFPYPTITGTYETLTITHYDDYVGVPSPLTATLNSSAIFKNNR